MELLERADELKRLDALCAAARAGEGAVMIVEGEAGIGKTALLAAARERAGALTVLEALGGALERDFAYGVVRQLLGRELPPVQTADRADAEDALYWRTVDLAAETPVLLIVDDAHWADLPSLRWLVYLARRIDGLGAAVLVAWRSGEPDAPVDLLEALRMQPSLAPGALGHGACAQIVRSALPDAEDAFCAACRQASGGNPFLIGEIVRTVEAGELAPVAASAPRVAFLRPQAVARSLLTRLAAAPPGALALARSLAVLDDGADLALASSLAGIGERVALDAARALSAAHIFDPRGRLRFAHPILRSAVYDDLPSVERDLLHQRSARLLSAAGQPERAAVHLLNATPLGEAWAAGVLRQAAGLAMGRGAADTAAVLLRRALDEPHDGRVVFELGSAERRAGDPAAIEHLRMALEASATPDERVAVTRELSSALMIGGDPEASMELLETALADLALSNSELRMQLEVEFASLGLSADATSRRAGERVVKLAPGLTGRTAAERALLAAAAMQHAMRRPDVGEVTELAERAFANGAILDDGRDDQVPVNYLTTALRLAGGISRARQIADQAVDAAAGPLAATSVLGNRAWVAWAQGDLVTAETDARTAIHASCLTGLGLLRIYALGALVLTLNRTGDLASAERALEDHDLAGAAPPPLIQANPLLLARAELRMLQGRYEEALRDVTAHFARDAVRRTGSLVEASRVHALVLFRTGDLEGARRAADARLSASRRFGLTADAALMLAVRGAIDGDLAMLEEAASLAGGSERPLVEAQVLLDLGAALRRANRRADARGPLRRALEVAHACGAFLLEEGAHEELLATGARPRRLVLSGADALTASERRIAAMAARGDTNRQIAQALFVTPKTVETHLRGIFRKLDVGGRGEIAAALGYTAPDAVLTTILVVHGRGDVAAFRGRKVRDLPDGFVAAFDAPSRALSCALALRPAPAGIHTGEVDRSFDGPVVDTAAGLAGAASSGEVLVSRAFRVLAGDLTVRFEQRGPNGERFAVVG